MACSIHQNYRFVGFQPSHEVVELLDVLGDLVVDVRQNF